MTSTLARIKAKGKNFEIMVDLDKALELRKGGAVSISQVLEANGIFYNSKEGSHASSGDLEDAFGTTDVYEIAQKIVEKGEIQLPQEYRDKIVDDKKKKIVDFFVRNAMDPRTGNPYTPDVISTALDNAHVNIDNRSVQEQIGKITEALKTVIPIKIEVKRIKVTVPAANTGQVYGLLQEYKEKEEWLSNGDLVVVIAIPVGLQTDFYDKLNAVTHGSAITEEIKNDR